MLDGWKTYRCIGDQELISRIRRSSYAHLNKHRVVAGARVEEEEGAAHILGTIYPRTSKERSTKEELSTGERESAFGSAWSFPFPHIAVKTYGATFSFTL